MMNFRKVACLSSFLMLGSVVSAHAGPFGTDQGATKESLDIAREVNPFEYELRSVKKPHSEFRKYHAIVTPKAGLCVLSAFGRIYNNDGYGSEVRSAYSRIRSQLSKLYGKDKAYDYIKSGGLWTEAREWVMSIAQNERVYTSFWDKESGSTLKDGISSVRLEVVATSSDSAYLYIQYEFSNSTGCAEEITEAQSDNL